MVRRIQPRHNRKGQITFNVLRADPTRLTLLRQRWERDLTGRFRRLAEKLLDLVAREDALGLAANYNPSQPRDARGRWSGGGGGGGASVSIPPGSAYYDSALGERLPTDRELDVLRQSIENLPPELKQHIPNDAKVYLAVSQVGGRNTSQPPVMILSEDMFDPSGKGVRQHELMHGLVNPTVIDKNGGASAMKLEMQLQSIPMDIHANRYPNDYHQVDETLATIGGRYWSGMTTDKQVEQLTTGGRRMDVEAVAGSGQRDYAGSRAMTKVEGRAMVNLWRRWNGIKGLTSNVLNQRWTFHTAAERIEAFSLWLATVVQADILLGARATEDAYWAEYIRQGYERGAGRAFDDTRVAQRAMAAGTRSGIEQLAWYEGTREQFLASSFGQPVAREKVQLLAARAYTDLKGVTDGMATAITRTLTDGMVEGKNPWTVARDMQRQVDSIGRRRALVIARTEMTRAHAEGQLDAMELLGVKQVGAMVEWDTAGDGRVCPLCSAIDGVVLKIEEARGLIPRHPQCRCAYVPANVGEPTEEQIRAKGRIKAAIDRSVRAETPGRTKRSLARQKQLSSWPGAGRRIARARPKPVVPSQKERVWMNHA